MTTIALLRHGQTDWNFAERIQGSSDISLNDTGREQARVAGRRLGQFGATKIVSSPLDRAAETAALAGAEFGVQGPDERLPDLAERAYGTAEGMPIAEMWERWPNGVPDAEPELAVVARARAALTDLAARMPNERVLAATHGGVIGRLLRSLPDSGFPSFPGQRVRNASTWVFEVEGDDIRFVEELPTADD